MPQTFRLSYVDLMTPSVDDAMAYYDGVLGATAIERWAGTACLSRGLGCVDGLTQAKGAGFPAP